MCFRNSNVLFWVFNDRFIVDTPICICVFKKDQDVGSTKLFHKTLGKKCQALEDIEKTDKDVATKYGLPKNTKSSLVQNKDETLSSLEKEQNVKRQKLCAGNHGIRRSRF